MALEWAHKHRPRRKADNLEQQWGDDIFPQPRKRFRHAFDLIGVIVVPFRLDRQSSIPEGERFPSEQSIEVHILLMEVENPSRILNELIPRLRQWNRVSETIKGIR